MSDTWYLESLDLPPYETWDGDLWTWDGICLNPRHTCEPPEWYHELALVEIQAEVLMQTAERMERYLTEIWWAWETPRGFLEQG